MPGERICGKACHHDIAYRSNDRIEDRIQIARPELIIIHDDSECGEVQINRQQPDPSLIDGLPI